MLLQRRLTQQGAALAALQQDGGTLALSRADDPEGRLIGHVGSSLTSWRVRLAFWKISG
jgi:hypothetical protein